MIFEILAIYASIILGCAISTTTLVLLGMSWGPLPHLYLELVAWIQSFYPNAYPESVEAPWPAIIKKSCSGTLVKTKANSSAQFSFLLPPKDPLQITIDAIQSGLEAIVQDNVSTAFCPAPSCSETLLESTPRPHWTSTQRAVFYIAMFFRFAFLFPIRLCMLLTSLLFIGGAGVIAVNKKVTDEEKTWIGIVFCRLYCCAMGAVATYKNTHLRPTKAGVAISNHLTPNDVQVLFAGTPHGSTHGFVITGQKHKGFIGSLETLSAKVSSTFWLERKSSNDRREFLAQVIKNSTIGAPVLLFPEGYCTNNTQVLQFRKAIFEDGVRIYPIAVKQESRFGDAFWHENSFYRYLARVMSSWATSYEIVYLAPMTRRAHESNAEFAARAQLAICDAVRLPVGEFDGAMWYSKYEQRRLLNLQKEMCALAVLSNLHETSTEKIDSDDGYFSTASSTTPSQCSSPVENKCNEILVHSL